jgi:hypothetical protein
MKSTLIQEGPEKTVALVFDTGDEVAGLLQFARDTGAPLCSFHAVTGRPKVTSMPYRAWCRREHRRRFPTSACPIMRCRAVGLSRTGGASG